MKQFFILIYIYFAGQPLLASDYTCDYEQIKADKDGKETPYYFQQNSKDKTSPENRFPESSLIDEKK